MSRIGVVVVGKTTQEIFAAAQAAREKLNLGLTGRLAVDNLERLLEKRICPAFGVDLDVIGDDDSMLAGAYAAYSYGDRVLRVKESVVRKLKLEDPEAIFTICHELGHICLHSDPAFFRRELPRHLPKKMCDPEWQADRFAIEFCVDRQRLMELFQNSASAAAYFRVPLEKLKIYLAELDAEGKLQRKRLSKADKHFEAVQEDFDF